MFKIIIISIFTLLVSCGGISVINKPESEIYSKAFLNQINLVKQNLASGNNQLAQERLLAINSAVLSPVEKAYKKNLLGVIDFSKGKYFDASENFNSALKTSSDDPSLTSRLQLNLASAYFKLNRYDEALRKAEAVRDEHLEESDKKGLYKLSYRLASQLNKNDESLKALINLLGLHKTVLAIQSDSLTDELQSRFKQLDKNQRLRVINSHEKKNLLSIAYLAYKESEARYYEGDRDTSDDLVNWLESNYSENAEVMGLIGKFGSRISGSSKMNPKSIGVILPFNGSKLKFAKRVLSGIEFAFKRSGLADKGFSLHVRDSRGNGEVGSHAISELIQDKQVAVVIGGLFSEEAKEEYLEAKRRGVFFISLSPVYLKREEKSHLLLELPGSVESQVESVLNESMINHFGKSLAVIYPNSDKGNSFIDEIWRQAKRKGLKLTGVQSFDQKTTDFRPPVEKLLGLKYKRERKEELTVWKQIYELEKKGSIRRIQMLKPIIDFDWVYLPVYPNVAFQLVPAFKYFDAFNVSFIGGPNWRNRKLLKKSSQFGKLYFVGDEMSLDKKWRDEFKAEYKKRPKVLEVLGYDSVSVISKMMETIESEERAVLEKQLITNKNLIGVSGSWSLNEGLWIKNLKPYKFSRSKIEKFQLVDNSVNETEVLEDKKNGL